MKIAFFDSGIGGLTVFKKALYLFPNENYIYFADSYNAPYGSRSKREVEKLIVNAIDFLAGKNIDVLVLACHTASRLMTKELRNRYRFPIIGMHSGIPEFYFLNNTRRILVCGTDLSVKTWKEHLSHSPVDAHYTSLQKLVTFAENFEFNPPKVFDYLYHKLAHYDWHNYHAIVLGCTHFPFFKPQIQKIIPRHVQILDGSLATVQQLETIIPASNLKKANFSNEYFISKVSEPASTIQKYFEILNLSARAPEET